MLFALALVGAGGHWELGGDHGCPSWGPASHTALVGSVSLGLQPEDSGRVHLHLWRSLWVPWAAGTQVACAVVWAAHARVSGLASDSLGQAVTVARP